MTRFPSLCHSVSHEKYGLGVNEDAGGVAGQARFIGKKGSEDFIAVDSVVADEGGQEGDFVTMSSPTASLTVEPQVIQHGQIVTLKWVTTGADEVLLNGWTLEPCGEMPTCLDKSTTFHLLARNRFGTERAEARVTMEESMADTTVIQYWLQSAIDKNIHIGDRELTDAEFSLITRLLQVMAADEAFLEAQ